MKILMSAYSCEPGRGSEPGVGWNMVRAVAQHHEVWVLTRPDESGDIIQAELDRHPVPNLHFVYFTLPIWGGGWRWGESGAMQIHYYLWQIQAYFVARQLHHKIGFDAVHHVTFVKYSNPSFLSFLPIPFVWGPVGGGESAPPLFWQDFSLRAKAYEWARATVRRLGELDPFVRLTGHRSAIVRATTEDTAQRLRHLGVDGIQIVTESGLSAEEITQLAQCPIPAAPPIRFISMGRLLHWKGFHLGIRAFAQANIPDAEYWILGDGAEQHRLQALAIELGVASRVKFLGKLPRAATLEKLADCHILVHPSLHDSGGWVCLEAMAAGRPVLCLDLGGPGVQVTEQTGIKIPAIHPAQAVQGLASAMMRLAMNEELRSQLGSAGQQRVRELYSWQAKGEELSQLYQTLAQTLPVPSGVRYPC
ncbi:MAG: glycosyltransferase [Leptolyngbyaceae cyanobacterium CSU_1_4]|nr:glycosyltransferase [Leptolyngbyaceae cyanobacterium CSU_1_4]